MICANKLNFFWWKWENVAENRFSSSSSLARIYLLKMLNSLCKCFRNSRLDFLFLPFLILANTKNRNTHTFYAPNSGSCTPRAKKKTMPKTKATNIVLDCEHWERENTQNPISLLFFRTPISNRLIFLFVFRFFQHENDLRMFSYHVWCLQRLKKIDFLSPSVLSPY